MLKKSTLLGAKELAVQPSWELAHSQPGFHLRHSLFWAPPGAIPGCRDRSNPWLLYCQALPQSQNNNNNSHFSISKNYQILLSHEKEKYSICIVLISSRHWCLSLKWDTKGHIPVSIMSMTTSLAWTSIVTKAPRVILVCFDNFPLTNSTMSFSWFWSSL